MKNERQVDMGRFLGLRAALVLVLAAAGASAVAADANKRGGSDPPLITRYAGSTLSLYGDENFGTTRVFADSKGKPVERTIEGKISSKVYWGPKGRSALEVYRNYQAALQGAGFTMVYSCETAQCECDGRSQRVMA